MTERILERVLRSAKNPVGGVKVSHERQGAKPLIKGQEKDALFFSLIKGAALVYMAGAFLFDSVAARRREPIDNLGASRYRGGRLLSDHLLGLEGCACFACGSGKNRTSNRRAGARRGFDQQTKAGRADRSKGREQRMRQMNLLAYSAVQTRREANRREAEANRLARTFDPDTSHEAAVYVVKSGIVSGQKARVLDALRSNPRRTTNELAARSGIDRHVVGRRMSGLESDGLVRRLDKRRCDISGRLAYTWEWTGAADEEGSLVCSGS